MSLLINPEALGDSKYEIVYYLVDEEVLHIGTPRKEPFASLGQHRVKTKEVFFSGIYEFVTDEYVHFPYKRTIARKCQRNVQNTLYNLFKFIK